MNILDIAQSWLDRGFSVIPIGFRSKRPSFRALRWTGSTASWEPYKERQATRDELRMWFGPSSPTCNLGLVTGFNGLTVIDFDTLDAYGMWLHLAACHGGIMAAIAQHTYRVMTARGMHVYLQAVEDVESYQVGMIDVKAQFGYVLAPPSVHPSGHLYEAVMPTARVMQIERLSDVFPLERPAPTIAARQQDHELDPWEVASGAIECGGMGAVSMAKARLTMADLVTVAYEDVRGSWALCPLHGDTNPSLRIYADDHWHCFGCDAHGGDVIDLYAAMHGLTNREAIAELANR